MLIFGCGYSGSTFARVLMENGWDVAGTTRDQGKLPALATTGVEAMLWPGDDVGPMLERATHLLISVGPDAEGDPVLRRLEGQIAARARELEWVGYLSTTGVYGNRDGGWVDETSALEPTTRRGRQRKAAEEAWLRLWREQGLPVHIFRLAGIYGPGRGPFEKVQAPDAQRIIKPGQIFSRIHVEDIARVLMASVTQPRPGAVYNVCDDDPAPPEEVLAEAARMLGLAPPPAVPFETAELSPMARSFYADSKRVSNRRIHEELGVALKYPDYRSGLRAILAAERA